MIPNGQLSESNWKESQDVLRSLHRSLTMAFGQTWMAWQPDILYLVSDTKQYSDESEDFEMDLIGAWQQLAKSTAIKWDELVSSKSVLAEDMDAWDAVEHDLLMEDDDCIVREDISMHSGNVDQF